MKKLISILIVAVMCISLAVASFATTDLKFTDVNSGDWFYNDVKIAVESGLVNGKTPDQYKPNDNLTYAEAFKLAACMNQLYTDGEITLTSGTPWYQTYVDHCVSTNIGAPVYDDVKNKMNEPATREAYMTIFSAALPANALEAINNVPDGSIPDVAMENSLAQYIYKLYRAGILTGVDKEHNCNPKANIKRSEVAAILTRMMNKDKRVSFNMGEEEKAPEVKDEVKEEPKTEVKEEVKADPMTITTQPKDVEATEAEVAAGSTATFKVKVKGGKAPYSYEWQWYDAENNEWFAFEADENTKGITTSTLTCPVWEGMNVVCVVTDANGESILSEVAGLSIVKSEEPIVEPERDPDELPTDWDL